MFWFRSVGGVGRIWAVESAIGLGRLLSQQFVASGEAVVDVKSVLASHIGLLSPGTSDKNDPNDACSAAMAALRRDGLAVAEREDQR